MSTLEAPTAELGLADLSAFQRDILWVVSHRETAPKGLAIKADLEAYYGDEEVNHGRLYPNLDALIEAGYLTKGQRDRRTNEYDLTVAGASALSARVEWEESGQ